MTISVGFDGPLHPLLWRRLPGDALVPATPREPEEALGMMERSHAASAALLQDEPVTDGETVPLSVPWFDAVREACARTGPVPGVERYLLEWWVTDPPAEGLTQLPWLFGVWQDHWVCWAGTTPWAAADQRVTTAWDRDAFEAAVRFGADPEHPPADPWTILGTSALAVPTVILLALAGKPATGAVRMPVTPTPRPVAEPEAEVSAPLAPSLDVLEGRIPPPPGAPGTDAPPEPEAGSAPVAESTDAAPDTDAAAGAAIAAGIAIEEGTDSAEPAPAAEHTAAADTPAAEDTPAADNVVAESTESELGAEDTDAAPDTPATEEPAPDAPGAPDAPAPDADEAVIGAPTGDDAVTVEPAATDGAAAEPAGDVSETTVTTSAGPGPEDAAPSEVAPIEPPPTPTVPTLPPADWYTDPTGRHQLRYWDGSRWTEHAADQATGQVVDPL